MRVNTDVAAKIHQGKNVKRFREMLGLRQENLADRLGPEWNQKRISLIESREIVDPNLLKSIAEVLKIPVQVLENFNEQAAINYFNTFNNSSYAHGDVNNTNTHNFDPLNALIEAMKELKAIYGENRELYSKNEVLYAENKELYAGLLNLEREKNSVLQSKLK